MSPMKLFGGTWARSHARSLRGALFGVLALGLTVTAFPGRAHADEEEDAEAEEADVADDVGADVDVEDTDPSAVVIYRSKLAPYGQWVDHPVYGTVWVPSSNVVGPDFAPYVSSGHWALTDDGDWLWVSDYDWGYIPFHYGRWVWVSGTGWAWIPGRTYSHAWVVWRVGAGGYIGWAPMPPAYYWSGGYAVALWAVPPAPFCFVHTHHAFHHHVHTYVIHDRHEVHTAAQGTHHYQPARPKAQHTAASPTLTEAGVPRKDAPKMRSKPDQRALDLRHSDKDQIRQAGTRSKASSGASRTTQAGTLGTTRDTVKKGGTRTSTATVGGTSNKRARRVAPIVGQRVDAARGESNDARMTAPRPKTKSTVGRPTLGKPASRPSVDGPSVPQPSPSVPRAQPVKKRVVTPAPTGAAPVRRAPRSVPHKR